ncbi:PA2169 family four-helix-bundle protein [Alteromonas ponticola]|uniref:PA2169 family four-helix-bundle protein n=1 Tax=Alteromonas aquimaris TaxID=2998417 RepID=A0ABT3P661_9ALTE|nr:PA2169 family four-helix-bundle protein [Alteromonas aquimaris]MCW8108257.1 PA2169 family four-helix-bundle protein [Alteromonas aquimaris]
MDHQAPSVQKVSEIIKVLNGGIEFYQDGVEKVNEARITSLFTRMIEEKKEAVTALQPYAVAEQGRAETNHDVGVDIRNMYTTLVGSITSDKAHTYIKQLEEVEDKVLLSIDEALEEEQPSNCAAELRRIRTRMQQCHDEMKLLQTETA